MSLRWNEWLNKQIISPGFLKLSLEMLIDSFFFLLALVVRINKKRVFPASHGLSLLAQGVGRSSENKSEPVLFICSHLFIALFSPLGAPNFSHFCSCYTEDRKGNLLPVFSFSGYPRHGETLAAPEDIQSQDEDGGGQYPFSVNLLPIFIWFNTKKAWLQIWSPLFMTRWKPLLLISGERAP